MTANEAAKGSDRRAGRVTLVALLACGVLVGTIVAYGLWRSGSDDASRGSRDARIAGERATATGAPDRAGAGAGTGSGLAERIGRDRAEQAARQAALAAAAAGDESESGRREAPDGPTGAAGAVDRLAAFQAAQRARRGPWEPGRSMRPRPSVEPDRPSGVDAGATSGFGASLTGAASTGEGGSRGGAERPLGATPEPGAVEVLGVVSRTAAHDAGLRRGMRILEFDGQPVVDRASLEAAAAASAAAGQPSVPVLVEDRSGEVFVLDLAPDVSGALLSSGEAPAP